MRYYYPIFILGLLAAFAQASSPKYCELYKEAYVQEIKPKIEAGVPFELMLILVDNGQSIFRKVVHIRYNLWDEVISFSSSDKFVWKAPLIEGEREVCRSLEIDSKLSVSKGKKLKLRLLLNPLWSARIARLQMSATADQDNRKLIDINWKRLADEMPSEKLLLEKEIDFDPMKL